MTSPNTHKRVVIKIGAGSLATGYDAAVQIGEEGTPPQVETVAHLPPAPELRSLYEQWQQSYRQLGLPYRIKAQSGVTNFSDISAIEQCRARSQQLRDRIHHWLNSAPFQPIREKLLEQLSPADTARILLQTQDPLLQRLPWYELHFFQRYRNAEVGISTLSYQKASQKANYPGTRSATVRILAIFGDATGLDTQTDRTLLTALPNADVHILTEPTRETFNNTLWDIQGWDILFFAGHSQTLSPLPSSPPLGASPIYPVAERSRSPLPTPTGELQLSPSEKLTIPQLKHALSKAIERGLNTAIFNSCDGLGLAADLADLHIPQVLVMREPVPDPVAHAFLQGFLSSFASGLPFYTAVREAREKMQGLEARYPCATWLPVIVQNLAEIPPTWHSLQNAKSAQPATIRPKSNTAIFDQSEPATRTETVTNNSFVFPLLTTAVLLLIRFLGLLAPIELAAYDVLLRLRSPEPIDDQLLIITNTSEDVAAFPDPTSEASMTDQTLLALLEKLTPLSPTVIGLDIYRDSPAALPALAQKIQDTDNLIFICKAGDPTTTPPTPATSPPPEISGTTRVGASDFLGDFLMYGKNDIVRRHLMGFSASPPCNPEFTFSTALAQQYLKRQYNVEIDNTFIGSTQLPFITQPTFGGYANVETEGKQILLNYRILKEPSTTSCKDVVETPARCLTVSEVLQASPEDLLGLVEDRIVLIGTTAPEFIGTEPTIKSDLWLTPYTITTVSRKATPGLFLQAQMVSQLINAVVEGRPLLKSWPEWMELIWIASWALLGGLLGTAVSRGRFDNLWVRLAIAESVLLLLCWAALAQAAVWIPWVPSAIALPTTALIHQRIKRNSNKRFPQIP
ncbi:MAG: CHASE2 domain-containing protein [Cyanobacteria bacterium J06632_3]